MSGNEFRVLRKKLRLTQVEMAREMDVSRAVLARWETGATPISTRTELAAKAVAERLVLAHAPNDYLELIEELKARLKNNKLTSLVIADLFGALGAHDHHCIECGARFRCYCGYPADPAREASCSECNEGQLGGVFNEMESALKRA